MPECHFACAVNIADPVVCEYQAHAQRAHNQAAAMLEGPQAVGKPLFDLFIFAHTNLLIRHQLRNLHELKQRQQTKSLPTVFQGNH